MTEPKAPELAAFILRTALGVMYLAHSLVLKLATFGLPGTAAFFAGVGLPRSLAYVTFAAEAIGGAQHGMIDGCGPQAPAESQDSTRMGLARAWHANPFNARAPIPRRWDGRPPARTGRHREAPRRCSPR